jgi:hypothetical protein
VFGRCDRFDAFSFAIGSVGGPRLSEADVGRAGGSMGGIGDERKSACEGAIGVLWRVLGVEVCVVVGRKSCIRAKPRFTRPAEHGL